jgi:hypothetical protein|tara:strand:- start:290 stop:502 length:213 start_codon:yes stop_codon:yes gene_type:complete
MNLYSNIIHNGDKAYKILIVLPVHNFLNSNNTINKQVLGMYVNEKGGDHVLKQDNNFLICETIEEAQIVE